MKIDYNSSLWKALAELAAEVLQMTRAMDNAGVPSFVLGAEVDSACVKHYWALRAAMEDEYKAGYETGADAQFCATDGQ